MNITQSDKLRWFQFRRIGCVACRQLGHFSEADVHHLLFGGKRRGHRYTIPLCPAHHRGVEHDESIHGPSLATNPREFRARFGSDDHLLKMTDDLLGRT